MNNLERTPSNADRYVYAVRLVRVIDGDTVVLDVDLGCDVWIRNQHCRLIGINAPEPVGSTRQAGDEAAWRLRELLSQAEQLLVRTFYDRKGSFRRLLVQLWADGLNINERLVAEGYAGAME